MKLLKFLIIVIAVTTLVSANAYAQPSLSKMQQLLDKEELQQPKGVSMKLTNSTQAGILFTGNTKIAPANSLSWLSQKMALRQNEDALVEESKDAVTSGSYSIKKIHQYYKGIKVEHGVINTTSKNGIIKMMQLEYYAIPDKFNTTPAITEEAALNSARKFTGASIFAWDNPADPNDEERQKPRGELVIIQTYKAEGEVCLAYKFNIFALAPMSKAWVYVNASNGVVVLDDAIIKHAEPLTASANSNKQNLAEQVANEKKASDKIDKTNLTTANSNGTADTRFSGNRNFVTDLVTGGGAKPYRLRQSRNGYSIITLDYQRQPGNTVANYEAQAIDFKDNDNIWTAAEYDKPANTNLDNVALDIHYNMQWVSDYWYNIHGRKGWDDNNGAYINYVHTADNEYDQNGVFIAYHRWYNNAYWNGKNMHFGDGDGSTFGPKGYLDVCGHELSHAITAATCNLVYRWESGALNESFSDIWGACITNYAKTQDPTLTGELIWRHGENRNYVRTANSGLRDLQNPPMYNDPSTYKSTNWQPGDYVDCPVESDGTNDHCGVHTNSGVFNKWFFLITQGEVYINSNFQPYAITGLGFEKTEKIAYLMEQNLTPNAGFATAMEVSLNIAISEYGITSNEYKVINDAWYAVGVKSDVFNMSNTPVFTTNNFTSIATDGSNILAGTNYAGLYLHDGTAWKKLSELTDVRINDIKIDPEGDMWIAQSGRTGQTGGGSSIGGGVNYLKSPFTGTSTLYTVNPQLHVPSRNARCMYIDPVRVVDAVNPKAWVATLAYITSSSSTSGMLGQGLNTTGNEFKAVNEGIGISSGTAGCLTVGGLKDEVWTFVQANNGINQLLQYNAGTNALIKTYDHNSEPALPSGFVARAIYGDKKNRLWVGLAYGGVMVLDEKKKWHQLNFSTIFPANVAVNYNAITGDAYGDVYIGTSAGLVFFDHGIGQLERLDDSKFYRLYSKKNGLASDNINAVVYNEQDFRLYVATDSGIVIWHPLCIGSSCNLHRFYDGVYAQTKANGNWSSPATWSTGKVPDSSTIVVITDTITVDIDAKCQSLSIANPGSVKINTGKTLKVFDTKDPIIDDSQKQRRRP